MNEPSLCTQYLTRKQYVKIERKKEISKHKGVVTMKTLLKTLTIIIGVVLSVSVLAFLFLYFIAIPDQNLIDEIKGTYNPKPEMEEKTRVQAQKYIDTVFMDGPFIIYDIEFYRTSPYTFF